MSLRYPIAIEPGDETIAFGVVAADLPGCFSAGDTPDKAMAGAAEATAAWLEVTGETPAPSSIGAMRRNPQFAGWMFDVVEFA